MQTYYTIKRRLLTVIMLLAFIFMLLIVRLGYIQLIWGKGLREKAYGQWMRELPLVAERGDILDRNGKIIAASKRVYDVYVLSLIHI